MTTLIYLIIIILIYKTTAKIVEYTPLGQYQFWTTLQWKLEDKFPKYVNSIGKFFSFEGFHCEACHSFWISLLLFTLVGLPALETINFAFITYFLYNIDNGQEQN